MRRLTEAAWAAAAAGLSFLGAFLVLEPWRGSLGVPYAYTGDANFHLAWTQNVLEHGWFLTNPRLGAPAGQQLYDYPAFAGDPLSALAIRILGLFSSDPAVVFNVFFLLTFPAAGLCAYLVLRRLTVSPPVAVVCSTLFALLPYHFFRGEYHLLLSAYYAVPVVAYLVLAVLGDRALVERRFSRLTLGTIGLCALVALASGSFYYSAFAVVLVAAAAVLRAGVTRSWRPVVQGGAVVAVIVALSAVTLAPSFVFWARHGTNPQVAHRQRFGSEIYGLKLAQLVLPVAGHRIEKLSKLRESYDDKSTLTEATRSTPLGIVGTVGFLWLLGVALFQLAAPGRRLVSALHSQLSVAALVALLFAWTGGLETFLTAIYPQTRAWNRLSVLIGFFALAAVALLLDRFVRGRMLVVVMGVLVGVLVVGFLDQTTPASRPDYRALAVEYRSDGDFVGKVEGELPAGASVLQLPHIPFPENPPVVRMYDYDHLRGVIHSHDVRWSYGAMRGRDDRVRALSGETGAALARDAAAAGFAGIYIDRFGYQDGAGALEAGLSQALGTKPLVSANERLSFFPLGG